MSTIDIFLPSSVLVLGLLLILSVFLMLLSVYYNKKPASGAPTRLPLGNLGWPILGEALDLASSCRKGSFHKFITDRMNKYSPQVFKTCLFGEKIAVFCGPAGNKFIFSKENELVTSWWPSSFEKIVGSPSFTASEVGKDVRRLIIPDILKPNALHGLVSIIHSLVHQHMETEWSSFNDQQTIKAHPLIINLVFSVACRLFIGVEDQERVARFSHLLKKVMGGLFSVPIDLPCTPLRHCVKSANAIRDMLYPIISLRRSQLSDLGTNDLLSRMLTAIEESHGHGNYPVTAGNTEIADGLLGLLIAGHDSTSSVLTSLVSYLADHQQVYDRVFQEQIEIAKSMGPRELLEWEDVKKMKYSRNVINEALRIAPSAQGSFRRAITDFTFAGYTIPKDWKIFWSVQTTHRNPEYFPDPDKFDPSRFEGDGPIPFTFVPFGGGPRMCPGRELARLQMLIILHCLVTKFRWGKLIPDEKIYCKGSPYPAQGLPIRLVAHENKI